MPALLFILLKCFALGLIIATLLPLLPWSPWWIRGFDFPRPQIAIGAVPAAILIYYFGDGHVHEWAIIAMLAVTFVWQIWEMFPFTRLYKTQVRMADELIPEQTLAILVANVLMSNRQSDQLKAMVREHQPHILLTLETNERWEKALADLEADYPNVVRVPQDNLYGMHLYSKLPLHNPKIKYLVEEDIPSIHTGIELASGQVVMFHGIHPAPPSPTENEKSVERDAELIKVAKWVANQKQPAIVTGDLNDVAWSRTTHLFRKISGLLDPRIGRKFLNTYHARIWLMRWPLDHIFHSNHFRLIAFDRLPYFGSDHFPIFCKLRYAPHLADQQPPPEPSGEDVAVAAEKLEEVHENPSQEKGRPHAS